MKGTCARHGSPHERRSAGPVGPVRVPKVWRLELGYVDVYVIVSRSVVRLVSWGSARPLHVRFAQMDGTAGSPGAQQTKNAHTALDA